MNFELTYMLIKYTFYVQDLVEFQILTNKSLNLLSFHANFVKINYFVQLLVQELVCKCSKKFYAHEFNLRLD